MSGTSYEVMIAMEANEIEFVALHRSERIHQEGVSFLASPENEVTTWNFAGALNGTESETDRLVEDVVEFFQKRKTTPCFKTTPMTSPPQLVERLRSLGYRPAALMSNMIFTGSEKDVSEPSVAVRRVVTDEDVGLFTRLQIRGFDAPSEWESWFLSTNRDNCSRNDHIYYIAEAEGQPAGVSLLLTTATGAGGLYAVATLEEYRGRGVGTALVMEGIRDSRRKGNRIICLNTETDGYAEKFFQSLGFTTAFVSGFYT